MKNYEAGKLTNPSLLFLAISLLILANPFISKAQSTSSASDLEGTEWLVKEETINPYRTNSVVSPQVGYIFEGQGVVTIIIDSDPLGIDPVGIPAVRASARGTYIQRGNSVRIEFSDHIIDVKIDDNKLVGEFKLKASGEKTSWAAALLTSKSKLANQPTGISAGTSSYSYSVPASNPFLGVWKYVEYSGGIDSGGIKIPPSLSKIVTITFHQDGSLDVLIQGGFVDKVAFFSQTDKSNWNYIPKTVSSGVLEQYKGNEIVAKSNVRWINNNQLEITATLPRETKQGIIYTREGENPNDYRSLIKPENILPDPCCRSSVRVGDPVLVTDALSKSPYPNVIRGADGKLKPAAGYQWVNPKDPNDFRVQLLPGLVKTEDGFRPAKGYRWVNPKDPEDFRVEPIP